MLKINKKIIITFIIVGSATLFLFQKQKSQPKTERSKQEIALEYEYGKFIQDEVLKKPFIKKLPIKTEDYIIVYSSIKQQIIVVFYDKNQTLDNLKLKFQPEIDSKLKEIEADQNNIPVDWEKSK